MTAPVPPGAPWQWGLAEAARATRDGAISCAELVESVIGRLDAVEPSIQAFAQVDRDGARTRAAELDRARSAGEAAGLLHGVPLGIKDIFDVAGLPTRCGSALYADASPAAADAHVVRRLRDAGAVFAGKTTTHELACGVYTEPTRNPWDLSRVCGGSSGGTGAAVAAGAVMGGTGSDTGGSIRIPAALCGIVGIKPTYGLLSRAGVAALSWSLDHVGPLARSVDDAALLFQAMLEPGAPPVHPVEPASLAGTTVGVVDDAVLSLMEPDVQEAFDAALGVLEGAGARIVHVSIPALADTLTIEFAIVMAEAAAYHAEAIRVRPGLISEGIRRLFQAGAILPAEDYLLAQRLRARLCRAVAGVYEKHRLDVIAAPSIPIGLYRPDELERVIGGRAEGVTDANVRTTAPFNLTGLPAVALPMGLDRDGLPLGIQFAGRANDDARVVAFAAAYEALRDSATLEASAPLRRAALA